MDINQILDQKIAQAQNDFDKMEYTVMKCLHKNQYDELFKMFGFDKKRTIHEVERYLGRKLAKPNQDQSQTAAQAMMQPNPVAKDLTPMTAESAARFFEELGAGA